jgi:hypothetical protein
MKGANMGTRHGVAAAAALALVSLAGGGVAGAAPPERITICHGTASNTNPYVVITVANRSFKDGHFDDQVDKSHGARNQPDVLWSSNGCAPEPPPN